ncbi:hypothetical protein TNCV_3698111 [Trichonephila clavipes]|uniref:Uncharacterized protein n=1 Tax=Trichonephila clavipes TaxID=2585209 RepID=A0A8X6VJS8_TRICX|nr:hypothetical protein TNCV_3698111 [Trichonephila clavipes]
MGPSSQPTIINLCPLISDLTGCLNGHSLLSQYCNQITGADFLHHYRSTFVMVDSLTKLKTQNMMQQRNNSGIKAVNGNIKFHWLLAEFPSLVEDVSTPPGS